MINYDAVPDAKTVYSYVENVVLGYSPWYLSAALLVLTGVTVMTYVWVTRFWPASFERMRDVTCPLPLPPGTMGCPYIGETLQFIRKGSDFYQERLGKHGKVYKTHLLGRPVVRVVGAEHVRPVLLGEHISVSSCWPSSVQQMVGADSLLGSTGDKHRLTKKLIISVFTPAVLASFVPRIQAVIRSHVERWCQMCSEEGFMHGFPACQRLSADIAMEVILGFGSGTRSRSDGHPNSEELLTALITFVDNLFSVPARIPGGGFWKGMRAREVLLQAVRQKLDESSTRADADFLSIVELLQEVQCPDGTCLRDNRPVIEDNALEMFFASYSTTSSALCSALLCLGRNPEVLGKVEAELREHGLMDERAEVTYDELNKLQYVHCVNREVLRLYPPAGAGFRKAEQTLQIGGYQIPEGWTVAYSIRETQHTSSEFTDTERFQPERWMASEGDELKERLRFHYIPFGSGARACVGRRLATMVQAIFVVELVRRSKWTVWNPWPTVKYVPVTRPADNLPVTFRHRTHTEENEAER